MGRESAVSSCSFFRITGLGSQSNLRFVDWKTEAKCTNSMPADGALVNRSPGKISHIQLSVDSFANAEKNKTVWF